ncbi:MAG TPA: response regulator transcription factor [Syntrophales bacterium]|nr:response regulator transcription factor [Syntrophales bacterium]HOM07764.1 response regulator transcription factor [Syntrophales bacterium]HON99467.1 response regulator transcription factor [Syntrophales bacterium]HPC00798.1 response regulator transcription factor [Syntrophales bacterium]HPQ06004.1 response regulator transcription factor [Syntrophales bacterium]
MGEGTAGKKRILVIEDDGHIAEALRLNLSLKGHDVRVAADGMAGLREWRSYGPHLIVLDVMLPLLDGLSVLRHIRMEDERLPILILSARGEAEYRVKGLAFGVDDYLSKPFHLDEFLLRVERLLVRAAWGTGGEEKDEEKSVFGGEYAFGGNVIRFDSFTAYGRGGEIVLTDQEVRLLKVFVANRGRVMPRAELLEKAWGYAPDTPTRTLDVFVGRFRRYFEEDPHRPRFFKSVRSVGYVFDHD